MPPLLTPTGLARIEADDDALVVRADDGQVLRLRPRAQLSPEAFATLLGGAPPEGTPRVFNQQNPNPLQQRFEDELVDLGAAEIDPSTGQLVMPGTGNPASAPRGIDMRVVRAELDRRKSFQRQLDQARVAQKIKSQQEGLDKSSDAIIRFGQEFGSSPYEINNLLQENAKNYPDAVPPANYSGIVERELAKQNPALMSESIVNMKAAYDESGDPAQRAEIFERIRLTSGPEAANEWLQIDRQERADRRTAELDQQKILADQEARRKELEENRMERLDSIFEERLKPIIAEIRAQTQSELRQFPNDAAARNNVILGAAAKERTATAKLEKEVYGRSRLAPLKVYSPATANAAVKDGSLRFGDAVPFEDGTWRELQEGVGWVKLR